MIRTTGSSGCATTSRRSTSWLLMEASAMRTVGTMSARRRARLLVCHAKTRASASWRGSRPTACLKRSNPIATALVTAIAHMFRLSPISVISGMCESLMTRCAVARCARWCPIKSKARCLQKSRARVRWRAMASCVSSPRVTPSRFSRGMKTCAIGAFRGSCGGDIAFRCGASAAQEARWPRT